MLTPEVIEGFAGACLAKRYDGATPTPECHKEWWSLCCSENSLVAIAAPRAHGKSTAITHAYLLAALLFRDRKFAVIVSDTETQAQMFLQDIKEELKNNDDIISLFGVKEFVKDSQTDIIVAFEDGEQFRILVRGAEQRVRGLKWDQRRPDLIICHEEGTEVYTPETGWIKNQDYPNAKRIRTSGYRVTFEDGTTEVVSEDHRYLTTDGWKYIWEMKPQQNVEEDFNGSGIELIENGILKELKHKRKPTESLRRVKQNVRSYLFKMLIKIALVKESTTSRIKRSMMKRLVSMLVNILNGKLLSVQKEEQQNLMLVQVG